MSLVLPVLPRLDTADGLWAMDDIADHLGLAAPRHGLGRVYRASRLTDTRHHRGLTGADYASRMPEARARAQSARVQSVDRTFLLLEQLADAGGFCSLSELAEATELPIPTAHRLLRFLTSQGYVQQESFRRYSLGWRLIRLGDAASLGLGSWVTPYLARLVERYGETANMAVLKGGRLVYIAQVPSSQLVRVFTEVGQVVMPHCTGIGKAILSLLPDEQAVRLLERTGMPAQTEHTLTSVDAMLDTLRGVRALGYAVDDSEQELGVRCVAVPIKNIPLFAGVSISGPSSRLHADDMDRVVPDLQSIAAKMSSNFTAHHPQHGSGFAK